MKRTSSFLLAVFGAALLLFSTSRGLAQANAKPPTQLTYQGFITDANGVPFGNTAPVNKTIIFRIHDALTAGTLKWSSQQVITVDKGYFSALLGQGSAVGSEPFNADLTGVFTGPGTSDRYLELTADGATIAPRLRFLPAPYAMLAKSATELLDPITGNTSLSISGGNLTVGGTITAGNLSGNGASLTSLNASQIASGTVPTARLPLLDANQINSGTLAVARIPLLDAGQINSGTLATARIPLLDAGQIASGTLANARTTATSANTGNAIVARDGSGAVNVGQVIADSFKIRNTQTLVLYSISRGSLFAASPVVGVQQSFAPGNVTQNGRQNANSNGIWYQSSQNGWGTHLYSGTFTVPAGELWEVAYTCQYYWGTDDAGGIVWTLNDALTDDGVVSAYGLSGGGHEFNQTFILSAGTHVTRVKAIIGGGSGSDAIYFPWHTPSHLVVKKYKSN